jgi:hypothetical protein
MTLSERISLRSSISKELCPKLEQLRERLLSQFYWRNTLSESDTDIQMPAFALDHHSQKGAKTIC